MRLRVAIFTEDNYGIGFFKKVINRLITEKCGKKNRIR